MRSMLLSVFLVGVIITGCAQTELTRRYKSAEWRSVDTAPVAISAFVITPPHQTAAATLLSLAPHGQAALIEALSEKSTSSAALLLSLGESVGRKSTPGLISDKTRFKRRIVLSAERAGDRRGHPEDRIHQLRWTISNPSADAEFISWDRFSTIYETVDLGTVNLQQSQSFDLEISAGPGPEIPVSGSSGYTASRDLNEEVSLRQRYVQLTGILTQHEAALLQQGVVGIDLSGNSFVDLEVKVPAKRGRESVVALSPIRDDTNGWLPQEDIDVIWSYLTVPKRMADITVDIEAEAVVREVRSAGRTVLEGDDRVEFIRGPTNKETVVLIPETSLKVSVWYIATADGSALELPEPIQGTVQFASYEEARDFMQWLREKGSQQTGTVKIGNHELLLEGDPVSVARIRDLGIKSRSVN